jgi:hypothetical protein
MKNRDKPEKTIMLTVMNSDGTIKEIRVISRKFPKERKPVAFSYFDYRTIKIIRPNMRNYDFYNN